MNDKLHFNSTYVPKKTNFLFHFVTLNFSDMRVIFLVYNYLLSALYSNNNKSSVSFKSKNMITWFIYIIPGFQLSTDVLSILILRYMRKDGTLRFGDFVSAILHLSVAFSK